MNKRGLVKGFALILLAVALLVMVLVLQQTSAVLLKEGTKANQFFKGNFTCEEFTDGVLWSAVGSKSAADTTFPYWNRTGHDNYDSNDCPGEKNCDIVSLEGNARYLNVGADATLDPGQLHCQIANSTEATPGTNSSRYVAFQNVSVADQVGPRIECGNGSGNPTCQVDNQGYSNNTHNYSGRCAAPGGGAGKQAGVIDVFDIIYNWCWTPIVYDADVTPESATNDTTFTFTINVTNPGANTTVKLLTRSIGGSFSQEGDEQYCFDCAQEKLTFTSTFGSRIGDREFKFTATDDSGFSAQANSTTANTNECLDTNNDCVFTVSEPEVAQGTPNLVNETVNAVTSGATEGWGSNWTFSVNTSNPAEGAGDIVLNLSIDSGSGFVQKGSQTCTDPCSTTTKFTFFVDDLMCTDISSAQYKFEATNLNGTSTTTQPFTIEKDDVTITHIGGNNSISNRTGTQTSQFAVRVFDDDNGTFVNDTNITFNVRFDDVNFDSGAQNTTNSTGHVIYDFDATCSPTKYEVGNRDWKATSGDACYKGVTLTSGLTTSVQGDIRLDFNTPDGSRNFTQEDIVSFLGATTDDCSDALASTVIYNANISAANGFACTDTSQIGANAFSCDFQTFLNTTSGFYNTTMFANASNHYDNQTSNEATPGLFFLFPIKKLENPQGNSSATGSTSDGWGSPNWNFSVVASSGDLDNLLEVSLQLDQSVNPTTDCTSQSPACVAQTETTCQNCTDKQIYWYKNFTNQDQGEWFFQFQFNDTELTSTSGTDFSITIREDETNISYGGQGNNTNPVANGTSELLSVRVFDIDRDTFNVSNPSANVTFKLLDDGYTGDEKTIGFNTTNSSGFAEFNFTPVCEDGYVGGIQNWVGEIETTDSNYNTSISANFTIDIDTSACVTGVSVDAVTNPDETFQNINFTINTSINAFGGTANDVNVTLRVPDSSWIVGPNLTQQIGSVSGPTAVSWIVNATTFGNENVSVFAISSNAGNDTRHSSEFEIYKEELQGTADNPTLPQLISSGSNDTIYWSCNIGEYRVATLDLTGNTSTGTILRVEPYNGTHYVDVLHSKFFNTSNAIDSLRVPLLADQITSNETGSCEVRITNLGNNDFNLTDVTLDTYYEETIGVRDSFVTINNANTTGLELDDELLNVSTIIENSVNETFSVEVHLNITNSSGISVNNTFHSNIEIPALSSVKEDFLNVNTSQWFAGNYSIRTGITGNFTASANELNRTENLIFENVTLFTDSVDYICNSTTESFEVTLNHPFEDTVEYNISLEMPSGWSYSGPQLENVSNLGNTTFSFNITSSNAASENVTINASASYTYPGTAKTKSGNHSVEEANNIPILEVTRESPTIVGGNRVFESALTIHNKGCGSTSSATITETLSTGWTPANPSIQTNDYGTDVSLTSATTDLETNVITWVLGTIDEDKYAVLTYQIKSPTSASTTGTLDYNVTWDGNRNSLEAPSYDVQTFNFTSESHLQFEFEANQQNAFPQPETRTIQPNETYNYTLTVTNIGDINATDWNVTLTTPSSCDVPFVFQSGTYDAGNNLITWPLSEIEPRSPIDLNATFNCTTVDEFKLTAEGIKDNRSKTSFTNGTGLGCEFTSGNDCANLESFTFSKPGTARYEKLNNVNFSVFYDFSGYNVTIGEGYVNITDDNGKDYIVWQNYTQSNAGATGTIWSNFTLDSDEQSDFVNVARNIGTRAFTDATGNEAGNVTVQQLRYTWENGKQFVENQSLFMSVKVYTYTPLFQNPKLYISGNELTSSNTSAERTGGWGEEFNFSVETRDRFSRNITVFAWHKVGAGSYEQIGNFTCENCDTGFQQINFTYDYNGSDISGSGGWEFKFNATNDDGSSEQAGFTYTVEKDDINTEYIAPDNEVNVNRTDTTVFSVRSFDRDNSSFPNTSSEAVGNVYISTSGISDLFDSPTELSADDGFFNRTVTNTEWCDGEYFLGKHGWYGGTEGSDFVKNNLTKDYIGFRNFTLVGGLTNTLILPDGTVNFTRGTTINFDGSVVDDCSVDSTIDATIVYNISNGNDFWQTCTGDATGACQIDTNSTFPTGFYNLTMTSTRADHNSDIQINNSIFFLGTVSQLDDPRKEPTDTVVPWGESPFTFKVNVTDVDNNTVTVELWVKNSSVNYFLENSTTCTNCDDYIFVTNKTFDSDNIAGNIWTFKFNSTDNANIGTNETSEITFNVTTDDITFGSFGNNNTIINRSDSNPDNVKNLSTTVTDLVLNQNTLDPSTPNISLAEITFNVNNGTSFLANTSEEFQNGSTNYYRQFNPGCNYEPGSQNWFIEVNNSVAYSDNLTSIGDLKVQVVGDINSTYISPTGQQQFERGTTITFKGNLSDDCSVDVSAANVLFNLTTLSGSNSYTCGSVTNATGNLYECVFDTSGKAVGVYNVTMIGFKNFYNNGTDLETSAVEIISTPTLQNATVDVENDGWGLLRTFSVNVSDNAGDNVTVELWQDLGSGYQLVGQQICEDCGTTTQLDFTDNYLCSEKGSGKTFKFNATDTEGNSYETTGSDYTTDDTFTIDEDDVRVDFIDGNGSVVSRENATRFKLRVFDQDNNTFNLFETATVSYNVSKTGPGSTQSIIGTNTTNGTGHTSFSFTPDGTFTVDRQDWLGFVAAQNCYNFNTSSTFNVTTLTNVPQLVNETVDPQTDGWGIKRTFNVTVKDENNTATVNLWRASSAASPNWILMNSTSYTDIGNFETLTIVQTLDPSLQDAGTWYFMFNSTNDVGNINDTGESSVNTANNFTVESENVLLEFVAGHNGISNRSGNQTTELSFRVQDENGTFLTNFPMKFHVQSDGTNFFTDERFVVNTNGSGFANFNFNATCSGDFAGAPKFAVGSQNWKITVNDSRLNNYQQNDSSSFITRNTSVRGDILLDLSTPDGSQNFTQEDTITFLGATTDDCGDAIVTTVVYDANSTENSFQCDDTTQIGANAFQCVFQTFLNTTRGFYNTTMNANKTLHYDNETSNTGPGGLFFINPIKKLENPQGNSSATGSTSDGWGSPNWNFSVVASSGDLDNLLEVSLQLDQSVNPTTDCTLQDPACVAQTETTCQNCTDKQIYWYKNFTNQDQGEWFFQFQFNDTELTSTSGTDFSITIREDETNISYGGQGNNTNPVANGTSELLSVRVFDLDKDSFNVSNPSANVTFKLKDDGYTGGEKVLGFNTTNSSGFAEFNFTPVCEDGYVGGIQDWVGEIEATDPNYNTSISENFTIDIDTSACVAGVSVDAVTNPDETFQNINFTINTSINAFGGTANDVNVTLRVPDSSWIVGPNLTQQLGGVSGPTAVSWIVNATTFGNENVSVFAISSNAGNDTRHSSGFEIYKEELQGTADNPTLPQLISSGSNDTVYWSCNIGEYRVATLDLTGNSSTGTILRVEPYNGTHYVDVLHSKFFNTSNQIQTLEVPLLASQITANETGSCEVRITNLGNNDFNLTDVTLDTYYEETIGVRDSFVTINNANTTGLELDDELLNVSTIIENSVNETFSVEVHLNITNSSGISVNNTFHSNIEVPALSSVKEDFLNVNTSQWFAGNYSIRTGITGNFTASANELNRTENLVFQNVSIFTDSVDYICNSTTESFEVTLNHPFEDTIEYNVSLQMPSGWSYSGPQLENVSNLGNTTFSFNITSSNAASENVTINASASYTYPGTVKTKSGNHSVEEANNIPILEVTRESPTEVAVSTEFTSRLAIYNKGCADASSISLTEEVKAGWTAFSTQVDGSSGGTSDIPDGEVVFTSSDIGTINENEYVVLSYKILSASDLSNAGTLRYNLSWGSRNDREPKDFEINTTRFNSESHLEYDLLAVDSFKERSAEKDENQFYRFNVTNVGDLDISNQTWNVSLSVPSACILSNHTGTFNSTTRKVSWPLGVLNVSNQTSFNFNLNCSTEGSYILTAEGINSTETTESFTNSTGIGCEFTSGNDCTNLESFTFSKPETARYEKLNNVNFSIFYDFSGYNVTIGEGYVNITDDNGKDYIVWQNYTQSVNGASGTVWSNFSLDSDEQSDFINAARNIGTRAFTDATGNEAGNVTVQQLRYTWDNGREFNDTSSLFIDIHPFIFDLPAPTLSTPTNDSLQAATPVGLSWEAISEPEGINITYYVYGDQTNASTQIGTTTDNLFLWRNLGAQQATFFWRVESSDGTVNKTSETRQFELDVCQPNSDFEFALSYPMSYNNVTDTITVWGSNGTNFDAMGNNESNPITFNEIFEFGQAVRGVCAVTNPSSGSFAILSRLELGNTTDSLNTTFVQSVGESLSFSKQFQMNFNSTFISGNETAGGSPFAGSTLSFSGTNSTDSEEGEFYLKDGSELRLFDTGVKHTITANNTNPFRLFWNGDVKLKASTLQNWYTIRFRGANNSLEDLILTDMGEGFFPAVTQTGTLDTINSRGIETGGLVLTTENTSLTEPNATITALEISEVANDILVINYTGTTDLINPVLNFSNINWTEGSFSGTINRKHDFTPTITDAAGSALANATLVLLDTKGDLIFSLKTDAEGTIPTQTITRQIFDYDNKLGLDQGPHTFYIQKYAKNFQTAAKSFSAATVETTQVGDNEFTTLSESAAAALANITYNPPTQVNHGDEINTTWELSGQLANAPVDQCQYFALFANNTKLVEGSTQNFTINYETGAITFNQNMSGFEIRPVYSYGGNVSVTNGLTVSGAFTMKDLYDFTQQETAKNNLSADLLTVDGLTYTFCVDLALGNNDTAGSISDLEATIEFNDGYDVVVGPKGGLLDLAGVGGAGLVESVEIGRPQINLGQEQQIYVSVTNDLGEPQTGETIVTDIFFPNGTIWKDDVEFTEILDGFYKATFLMPSNDGEIPYGVYATQIIGSSFVVTRTFEFVPILDLVSRMRVGDRIFDINLVPAEKGDGNITLKFETFNPRNENKTFSQFDLWERNYFLILPTDLMESHFEAGVYEVNHSGEVNIDDFEDNDSSDWSFSGDIISLNVSETSLVEGNFALNVTLNFSTGNATIAKNFSSIDFSAPSNELREFDVEYFLPDLNLTNISIKLKTNETDYFVDNRNLRDWKILFSGEAATHIDSFNYDKLQSVGSPVLTNITGIEITFIGTDNYTTPTSILVDDIELHKLFSFTHDRIGSKFLSPTVSTLFWWNENGTYTLSGREEREYTVILDSLKFEWIETWAESFPNDAFIQSQHQEALEANFYYEILASYEQIEGYLLANTNSKLSIAASVGGPYNPGNTGNVNLVTTDNNANLISANVTVDVRYPNGTTLNKGTPTESSTGIYNFSFAVPSLLGDYSVLINANDSVNNASTIHTFTVQEASGGGSGTGGLALNIFNSVGSTYDIGDTVRLFSTTVNSLGSLVNATVDVRAYNPDGTLLNSGESVRTSEGRFEYNFTAPSTEGTYRLEIDANYSGDTIFDTEAFIISAGGGGGGNLSTPPSVQVEAPAAVDINTDFSITALTQNDNGLAADCTSGANLTVRDTLNGTDLLIDASMTKFGTGLYNYTYSTGAQSTYVAIVDCVIGGTEYTGIKGFSTQNVSSDATGGGSTSSTGGLPLNIFADTGALYSPDDEAIVFAITTNSSGALVNASVNSTVFYPNGTQLNSGAMTEQSLGRYKYNFTLPSNAPTGTYQVNLDALHQGDEIHTTLAFIISETIENIATTVNQINTTVDNIQTTVNNINSTVNTINSTVNNIDSTMNDINSTVNTINSTVNNIDSTVNTIESKVDIIDSTVNNTNTIVNQTQSTVNTINSTVNTINSTVNNIDSDLTVVNSTVNRIESTVNIINSTVDFINTTTSDINSTVNAINSTVNNIWNLTVGKITLDADVGAQYNPNDEVVLAITTVDGNNTLINATVDINVYYPNGTLFNSGNPTRESTGRFNYSFTLPSTLGTYSIDFDANYSGNNVFRNLVFKVESATTSGTGGLPLNIFNAIGSSYGLGDTAILSSTVVNSSGNLVNATVNVTVRNPDGTVDNSGLSTLQSEGRFEYSFATSSSTQGTYSIDIDANYSGDEIHDTEAFVVSSESGGGGNLSTPPRVFVEAPTVIGINTNFSITMLSTDDAGLAADCSANTANLTIRDTLNGTELVSDEPMTKFGTGLYNYTYSTSAASSYVAIAKCSQGGLEYAGITTFSTQGFSISGGNIAVMSDFHELSAGDQYRTKVWAFDVNGNPINADSIPTVTLYDTLRNIVVQDVSMTQESTGVYTFNYSTSSGTATGVWETVANVTINGVSQFPSDFWEVEGSPAQVAINSITDKTITDITADVIIENEGTKDTEYQYEYCIVKEQDNRCGGDDDVAYASAAKFIEAGDTFNPLLTLDGVTNTGEYYFKVLVYWGSEVSGASQLFTAVEEGEEPAPSGDGGGGGGGAPAAPSAEGKPYLANVDVNILSKYLEIIPGEEIVAQIKITDHSSVKGAKSVIMEYSIQDSEGKIYSERFEDITFNEATELLREVKTSEEMRDGKYLFIVSLEFEDGTVATGRASFDIKSERRIPVPEIEGINLKNAFLLILATVVGIGAVFLIIFLLSRRDKDKHIHRRLRSAKKRQDLNKLVNYIKEELRRKRR